MVRTKVFVGNLSFTTKENELAKEFETAGKVISANIITRGPRSLGYGFVEMDNETDAENAVKLLDKKEIDGRPINVEVAKPREEGNNNNTDANGANAQGNVRGAPRPRGGRGGRGGKTTSTRPQGQQTQQGQKQGTEQTQDGAQKRQPRRRPEGEGEDSSKVRTRVPKPRRAEGPDTRTPSTTTLFVANLPFSVDDEAFAKLLKDHSLSFKTAHVVQKRTGRSKGFGFIEFDSEADQQKALTALNDKAVEGRQLAVKVALTEIKTEESAKTTSSPAPVKTTTTSSPAPVKTTTTSSPAPQKTTSTPAKTSSPSPAKATEKKDEKPVTPKQEKK